VDELAALLGRAELPNEVPVLSKVMAEVHEAGVTHVWLNRGPLGSLLSSFEDGTQSVQELRPPKAKVVDISGAGDSMTAGYVHSLLSRGDVVEAARFGQAVGSLAVESRETVRADLSDDLVVERLSRDTRAGRSPRRRG
jgi:pseudouridine kinase